MYADYRLCTVFRRFAWRLAPCAATRTANRTTR